MPERKHAGDPRCCFGATPLVGELPRSNGQTTAWPAAPSRPRKVDGRGKRGARKSINLNPDLDLLSSPSRSSSIAPAETIFRRARFFGTHAPRDKENQPAKCKYPRCRFGATPLVGQIP